MNQFFSMKAGNFTAWLLLNLLLVINSIFAQPLTLANALVIRWSYLSDSLSEFAPTGDAADIYLPLRTSELVCVGSNDGLLRWKADIGGDISSTILFDAQRLYTISESRNSKGGNRKALGIVRALSRANGVTLWVKEFPRPFRGGLLASSVSLYATLDDGKFYSIDKLTGDTRWILQFPHPAVSPPVLLGEKLYALTTDGFLIAVNHRTGTILERYRTEGAVRLQVNLQQHIIYLGTDSGYVFALNERSGYLTLIWRKRVVAALQDITATPEGVLVTTNDNFILLLDTQRGKRLWKRQMPARLVAPPSLGDGIALFSPIGEEACIALSLRDGKVINSLPIGKDNSVVASPLLVGNLVFIPTRKGLLTFAPAGKTPRPSPPINALTPPAEE